MDYVAETRTAFVDIELSHVYDNDRGLRFEDYPLLVTIRDRDRDQERQEYAAKDLFDALAATGRYRLMLTQDLQRLVALHPTEPGTGSEP